MSASHLLAALRAGAFASLRLPLSATQGKSSAGSASGEAGSVAVDITLTTVARLAKAHQLRRWMRPATERRGPNASIGAATTSSAGRLRGALLASRLVSSTLGRRRPTRPPAETPPLDDTTTAVEPPPAPITAPQADEGVAEHGGATAATAADEVQAAEMQAVLHDISQRAHMRRTLSHALAPDVSVPPLPKRQRLAGGIGGIGSLPLGELCRRARTNGASNEEVDAALDDEQPKERLIALITGSDTASGSSNAASARTGVSLHSGAAAEAAPAVSLAASPISLMSPSSLDHGSALSPAKIPRRAESEEAEAAARALRAVAEAAAAEVAGEACGICCETRPRGFFYGGAHGLHNPCGCKEAVCLICLRENARSKIRDQLPPGCLLCLQPLDTALVSSLLKNECPLCGRTPGMGPDSCAPLIALGCSHAHRFCGECAGKHVLAELDARRLPRCPRAAECHSHLDVDAVALSLNALRGSSPDVPAGGANAAAAQARLDATAIQAKLVQWHDLRVGSVQAAHPLLKACRMPDCRGHIALPLTALRDGSPVAAKCSECQQIVCAQCLAPPHPYKTCAEAAALAESWAAFLERAGSTATVDDGAGGIAAAAGGGALRALLEKLAQQKADREFLKQRCKRCPRCRRLIEKTVPNGRVNP